MQPSIQEPPRCRLCKEERKKDVIMRLSPLECVSEWRSPLGVFRGGYSSRTDRAGEKTTITMQPHPPQEAGPGAEQIGAVIQWRCPYCHHGSISTQARCSGAPVQALDT